MKFCIFTLFYCLTWLGVTLLSRVDQILSVGVAIAGTSGASSETQAIAGVQQVGERETVAAPVTSGPATLRGDGVQEGGDDVGIIPGGIAGPDVEEEIYPDHVDVVKTCRKTTFLLIFPNSQLCDRDRL